MAWLGKSYFVEGERMSVHKELVASDKIEKLITEFPIKIGQRVWFVTYYDSKSLKDGWVCSGVILAIIITAKGVYVRFKNSYDCNKTCKLGKSVFLTEEEAQEKLRKFLA